MICKVHAAEICRQHIVRAHGMMQGINDGIARDKDALFRHPLGTKVLVRRRRRCKVQGCNASREAAVHLLGERRVDVMRPQPSLNMTDRNLMVVCGESTCKRGRRVAVDKYKVGTLLLENLVDAVHGT